jgi:hypothetical protein
MLCRCPIEHVPDVFSTSLWGSHKVDFSQDMKFHYSCPFYSNNDDRLCKGCREFARTLTNTAPYYGDIATQELLRRGSLTEIGYRKEKHEDTM